ncbi:MAG TPA: peptidoglycan DD-metalloendopeptidase family protein [Micromonosporaceae bacterium]
MAAITVRYIGVYTWTDTPVHVGGRDTGPMVARAVGAGDAARVQRIRRWLLVAVPAVCVLAIAAAIVIVLSHNGRDAPAVQADAPSATPTPTPTGTPTKATPIRRVFPVVGKPISYGHTHHDYPATDIITPCGGTYVAPISGVVVSVTRVDEYDPKVNAGPTRGGLSVAILGDDGVRYYGSHFQAIGDNITEGVRVVAGDRVATVGHTGDASVCHVHFGLSPVCGKDDWFVRRGVIWPWRYLDSWRSGGNADPTPEIKKWQAKNGCPDKPTVDP